MKEYNTIKIRSKNWPKGYLRANFTVSTALAAQILILIGQNESHVLKPDGPARDWHGRFAKRASSSQKDTHVK